MIWSSLSGGGGSVWPSLRRVRRQHIHRRVRACRQTGGQADGRTSRQLGSWNAEWNCGCRTLLPGELSCQRANGSRDVHCDITMLHADPTPESGASGPRRAAPRHATPRHAAPQPSPGLLEKNEYVQLKHLHSFRAEGWTAQTKGNPFHSSVKRLTWLGRFHFHSAPFYIAANPLTIFNDTWC